MFPKREWDTPAAYPMGRTAEFVMAVLTSMVLVGKGRVLVEYVTEAEHQDGPDYWKQFPHLSDAVEDFQMYLSATEQEPPKPQPKKGAKK